MSAKTKRFGARKRRYGHSQLRGDIKSSPVNNSEVALEAILVCAFERDAPWLDLYVRGVVQFDLEVVEWFIVSSLLAFVAWGVCALPDPSRRP
jgi:hypothetical protein